MKEIKSHSNLARRRAREIALQVGYSIDINKNVERANELFDTFLFENELCEEPAVLDYARTLVLGVAENYSEIDSLLRTHITGWRPERMSITDRVAVQLALFEGVISKNVDVPVAISEALEIAKLFGSEESARFVNGVLGKIIRATES